MSIAFDSVSAGLSNGASPLTFAFDNVAGNFVAVILDPLADTVSSVTYNGVSMTSAGVSDGTSGRYSQMWYLANAPTGNNNVVVTGGGTDIYARAISFSGVQTASPVSGYNHTGTTGSNPSISVTTTSDNSFVLAGGQVGATPSGGANTTQPSSGANPQLAGFWYSTVAVTPAGAFTINVTASSAAWGLVAFAFAPQITFTATDTTDVSDDIVMKVGLNLSDTTDVSDDETTKYGWNNPSKSSSTWTNQSKS